jgi:hypothetical protein
MIGKSLSERYTLAPLSEADAVLALNEAFATQAENIVQVRVQGPEMIACLVVRADEASVRACSKLGFDIAPGGTVVFGLAGRDAARLFDELAAHQRAWLEDPCVSFETKVLLMANGIALLSIETREGKVAISAFPALLQ